MQFYNVEAQKVGHWHTSNSEVLKDYPQLPRIKCVIFDFELENSDCFMQITLPLLA